MKNKCNHLTLKMEADFDADPLWCEACGENLDIDDFDLSEDLKDELFHWVQVYQEMPMQEHDKIGQALVKKVKIELGDSYPIIFVRQG